MLRKILVFGAVTLLGLLVIAVYQKITLDDGKLHVIFCDVGQGDAIFIRTPRGIDILIDGGPDSRILGCLSRHMPFWDKTLELVILTHPHQDHISGLVDVAKSYLVIQFLANSSWDSEDSGPVRELKSLFAKKNANVTRVGQGDSFRTQDGLLFKVLWPPNGFSSSNVNDLSLVLFVSYKNFDALLTGDAEAHLGYLESSLPTIEVLKVPHHGSRESLDREFLEKVRPGLAVISVGKNNRFGHPHEETLKILRDEDIRVLRTDEDGEVILDQ